MPVIRIDHIDDPRLDDYRNVPDAELLRQRGRFVAEGRLVVQRLLASGQPVISLLLNDAALKGLEADLAPRLGLLTVYVCATAQLTDIVGFNVHRGCLALGVRSAHRTIDEIARLGTRLLILDGVTDADNVGSAFRNGAAFGVDGVVLHACCDPLYRKAIRTSMGHVLRMPFARSAEWPADLGRLKSAGFTLIALTPHDSAEDVGEVSARRPKPARMALMVGAEGPGLSADAESLADLRVRIPMQPEVDSINLATAAAIALHRLTS